MLIYAYFRLPGFSALINYTADTAEYTSPRFCIYRTRSRRRLNRSNKSIDLECRYFAKKIRPPTILYTRLFIIPLLYAGFRFESRNTHTHTHKIRRLLFPRFNLLGNINQCVLFYSRRKRKRDSGENKNDVFLRALQR